MCTQTERQLTESSSSVGSLQQTIHKLRDELAALRVECDSRGAKCQALESQLKETAAVRDLHTGRCIMHTVHARDAAQEATGARHFRHSSRKLQRYVAHWWQSVE